MDPLRQADVVVVGGGPAAHALARSSCARGLQTIVIEPDPDAAWPASYGAWADELPADLPDTVVAGRMPDAVAIGPDGVTHHLDRDYAMLSTPALQAHLTAHAATIITGMVDGRKGASRPADGRTTLNMVDGSTVSGRVVVDATGTRRVLTGEVGTSPVAMQTAVGVKVDGPVATPLAFMDWRADHGEEGWPTFLYVVPIGGGRVLLEETALARRPGLPFEVLHRRLLARLANRAIAVPDGAPIERVAIAVDAPLTTGRDALFAFGAAAPLVHPATGYSLASSLSLAGPVADAVARELPSGTAAAAAARQVIWPAGARAVHHLRRRGLEALLALPPAEVGQFFDNFFSLPDHHRRAYLSVRDQPGAVAAAMAAQFRAADWPLRRHLMRWAMVGRPIADDPPGRSAA